jgi:hypothetical protein
MVAPPLLAGAVNATVADVLVDIRAATPIVGAPGTDICVTLGLAILALLVSNKCEDDTENV